MAQHTVPLSIVVLSFLLLGSVNCDIPSLCDKTPFPELCNSFATTTSKIDPQGLRNFAFRTALQYAEQAYKRFTSMDLSSFDEKAKAAWTDCVELYEDTISKLNHTCSTLNSLSYDDSQTWLSAAINNLRTCEQGFVELNSTSFLSSLPGVCGNVSKLICNSLSINKGIRSISSTLLEKFGGGRKLLSVSGDFPTWVSAADRKLLQSTNISPDLVVAKDGTGNFKTISEAVKASASRNSGNRRFVIYVKGGVYNENVQIPNALKNIMMIGDGIDSTIVTGSRNVQDGSTTFNSATFAVTGDGFIARDMTFQNTAGPQKHQAVALRSGSDLSVFYRCSFKGYQDTLYVYSQRQFYRDCDIYGTIDFIFGDAAVVIQNCNIIMRKPMSNQKNVITAQGRSDSNENTGISIHNSRVTAASELISSPVKCYLGRPWKQYSRTVFMKTSLDGLIDPAGWLEWSGNFALNSLYYGEYMNTGPGSATGGRVKWGGYRVITSAAEAGRFTVGSFISGNSWLPSTGVPFTSGL